MSRPKRRGRPTTVVFADRDGTLIHEGEYMTHPRQVRLLPGAATALKALRRAGIPVVVISNQSGVGRGLISMDQLRRVQARFEQLLKRQGAAIDGFFFCPHHPDAECRCRKPKDGLLRQASKALGIPWRRGISVGDRPSDVLLGQSSGGQGILVRTGYGERYAGGFNEGTPDFVAANFAEAARWILSQSERTSHDGTTQTRSRRTRQPARRDARRPVARRR